MSDSDDITTERLMERLSVYARGISMALSSLPIPIELPHGDGVSLIKDFMPAVIRAYEIVDEQPIPEEQQAVACTALLHWVAAAELVIAFAVSTAQHRADGALLNMMCGEPLLADLIEWLVDPEGGEHPQD
ncbi:hypothetical protein [Streptomyces sp. NPDC058280]|uniref:hypothetical protein n=1 Tax=Streptomyces sp. NPDC058280 TaxID=3346419 RepID=UPI0036E8652D